MPPDPRPRGAPFVDRPVGEERAARRLAERAASEVGLAPPWLIRAAMNANYTTGDTVIRVGRPTADPAAAYALADALASAGIAVPRPAAARPVTVGDDGLVATAWERVESRGDVDWRRVGEMVARLHTVAPDALPASYPLPPGDAFPWWDFPSLLERAKPLIDAAAFDGLAAAVARHAGWQHDSGGPQRWVVCHGDMHPDNVIAGAGGPVLLDWDLLCLGPPAWDHGPLLATAARWGADPAWYDAYAAGYGADLRDDPVCVALTELRLVAATLMRVLAEGPDRGPDSEAERRLHYWRGDPDPPRWTVV